MKKKYICPETEFKTAIPVKFFCASPVQSGTIVDGEDGPTGPAGDDTEDPTEDDVLSKQSGMIWDEW